MLRTVIACLPIIVLAALTPAGVAKDVADSQPVPRSIILNVFDAHGIDIRDLTKGNFRVRLNGKPVSVVDARYGTAPRRIVVLLDMSASMTEHDDAKWKLAREAVNDLLAQAPKAVPIGMVTFTQRTWNEFNFSQSRDAISQWLSGPGMKPALKHPARTALYDAIVEGLNLLGGIEPGDALYAITDGDDNASRSSETLVKAALMQSQVRLFAFLLAPSSSIEAQLSADKIETFASLVQESGGFLFGRRANGNPFGPLEGFNYLYNDENREKVKQWTQWLNIQINEFWTLDLSTSPSEKKRNIKIEIVGGDGTARKDVGITYPRLLPPQK